MFSPLPTQDILEHLDVDDPQLPAALRAVGYFALLEPAVFDAPDLRAPGARDDGWRGIIAVAVNGLLRVNQAPQDPKVASEAEEWQPMTPECEAKVRQ